jgi:Dicarboxylate transport
VLDTPLGELIGTLDDDLHLTGELSLDPALLLERAEGQARFTVAAQDLGAAGIGRGIDLNGDAALDLSAGRLRIAIEGMSVTVAALGPELAALGAALPPPWRVSIGDAGSLVIETRPLEPGWAMEITGPVRLSASQGRLAADLAAGVELDPRGGLRALSPSRAVVTAQGLRSQGLVLESAWVELTAQGAPGDFEGTLQLEAAGAGARDGGPIVQEMSLRHDLAASFRDGRLELRARDAGSLALQGLGWPGEARVGPLALRLDPTEQPLLAVRLGDGQPPAWTHQLAAAIEAPFSANLPGTDPPLDLELAFPRISLAASGTGNELRDVKIELSDARVAASEPPLRLDGIRASAVMENGGVPRLAIEYGRLASSAEPPWFAPLSLVGTLQPSDGKVGFEGRLAGAGGQAELRFQGSHDPASSSGQVALRMPPVELAPGRLQPVDLVPAVAGLVEKLSGRLQVDGDLSWGSAGGLRAHLDLLLGGLSFTAGPARFQQADGVVTLNGVWPPTTPPGQEIAIGLLDVGLSLTGGLIDFQLHPDGALEVGELRWRFAGGTVRAEPFRVHSGVSAFDVTLRAERLSLDQLFALTELEGLSGEGRISGELPVRIQGSDAIVRAGELTSEGPGTLRYRPASTPAALQAGGENMGLLLQALENFRYEELRITLDGRTDAEMDVGLHIKGANPDLYDGHPIEFNLNLEGELGNILKRSLTGYRIPEQIRERIQGFPK